VAAALEERQGSQRPAPSVRVIWCLDLDWWSLFGTDLYITSLSWSDKSSFGSFPLYGFRHTSLALCSVQWTLIVIIQSGLVCSAVWIMSACLQEGIKIFYQEVTSGLWLQKMSDSKLWHVKLLPSSALYPSWPWTFQRLNMIAQQIFPLSTELYQTFLVVSCLDKLICKSC